MPVEVIKYTCEFKCGKKAVGEKSKMAGHESHCWKNPDNKTCKTCSNQIYEFDSDGYKEWYGRGCKIDALHEVLENTQDILLHQNSIHVRPIYKCPFWNKQDDGSAKQFAELLEAEIKSEKEGTEHYPFYNKPSKTAIIFQ